MHVCVCVCACVVRVSLLTRFGSSGQEYVFERLTHALLLTGRVDERTGTHTASARPTLTAKQVRLLNVLLVLALTAFFWACTGEEAFEREAG